MDIEEKGEIQKFLANLFDDVHAAMALTEMGAEEPPENYAQIGSSGSYAQIGSSGYDAKIGSSGDDAQIGSSGYGAQIGSSGDDAQIGSSGDDAKIGSSGYDAQIDAIGKDAVVACASRCALITLGDGGCIAVPFFDGQRTRFAVHYVGENGIEAGVTYAPQEDGTLRLASATS